MEVLDPAYVKRWWVVSLRRCLAATRLHFSLSFLDLLFPFALLYVVPVVVDGGSRYHHLDD